MSHNYSLAVADLHSIATARQAELDRAYEQAMADMHAAYLRSISEAAAADPALTHVCSVLATGLSTRRDSDGYPIVHISDEARALLRAARAIGLTGSVGVVLYSDCSGESGSGLPDRGVAYRAWDAAQSYRSRVSAATKSL